MFVGRERELQKLEKAYNGDSFEFAVFYGRRRIGKTTLIRQFLREKDSIYYVSVEGTAQDNLEGLSKALLTQTAPGITAPVFRDFEALLDYIDQICHTRRLILVIDEYPYLAASCPAISSMLQSHIDQCWKDSRLFLILCGSSISFMDNQVSGYKSPLYGRRTSQFRIQPFTYFEARAMLSGFSDTEQAVLYGVTGGVPEYLSRIRPDESLDDNIVRLFFDENGRLFEEPSNLLKQELREPATYQSIISAIAGGASRRTLYRLADNMFLFWYRFVRPNLSAIVSGMGEPLYDTAVKPALDNFMGGIFEEICRQYLYLPRIYPSLPFSLGNIGRWWGTNPMKKSQEEIDLMSVQGHSALFCECKWRNEAVDSDTVEKLLERSELFSYPDKRHILFSKSGFQDAVYRRYGENPHIRLISF